MTATWIKNNADKPLHYHQISTVAEAYVKQWVQDPTFSPNADNLWYIYIIQNDQLESRVKGPFPDANTAQTQLDNSITTLGGSV